MQTSPYRNSGGTVSVTPRRNGSDVQTWIINKEMFGMEQHLGLTNTGIKLHFCWQTDSMNLWAHGLIKEFHIKKKICWEFLITVRWYHSARVCQKHPLLRFCLITCCDWPIVGSSMYNVTFIFINLVWLKGTFQPEIKPSLTHAHDCA